ncbi:5-hydroxytryptamine receptor 3A-like [Colossoma macropomum]|uniref:5-hydroxytryptamine receptor 3A-like n=1 Tax=Colossoma macropomum TaxID=42526 RepID=UPI001864146C|nr:5-hydroxytryptamine receptor 3A-like [Colossoma macropomum]
MSQVKHSELSFIIIIIICFILNLLPPHPVESVNCSEPTAQALLTALKDTVLYRTEVRPVISLQTPTVITLDFYIYGILGVVSVCVCVRGLYECYNVLCVQSWNVEGLSWDPSECGTERISLPRTSVWIPDIVINEFMDENKVPATFYVYVNHTGHVTDALPFHVISSCNLDIYTFPFDIQNCSYTFNSYLHTMSDVQLSFADAALNVFENSLETLGTNGEWELIGIIPEKLEVDVNLSLQDQWDGLVFHIVLRRKAAVYVVNLLLPSCFLVALDVFSFLLPLQHVDRSTFKMTLILGYTVFLLLMNDLLPVTGNNIPLINVFFSVCLALMVGSLLETILVTNLLSSSAGYPRLPLWLKVLLQCGARLVCLNKNSKPDGKNSDTERADPELLQELRNVSRDLFSIRLKVEDHLKTDERTEEWIHLGLVIDRMLFILYFIFITISFIIILILWLSWYRKHSQT